MGILALSIWGGACSRELLIACLCHDLGESAVGDIPWPAKCDRTLKVAADRLEEQALSAMGLAFSLSLTDQRRLKYLDRLDAYLWAEHHRPDLMDLHDWVVARIWLINEWTDLERIAA
jgi:5'-deoxynucleotidase YfbR-like HD superfamily hydrolase